MDLRQGLGEVYLPNALSRKYPSAATSIEWQYVFPSQNISKDPRSNKERGHHIASSSLQKQVKSAIRAAGIRKNLAAILFVIHLQPGYWSPATIFVLYRSCWVIPM
jgi:integrase